MRAQYSIEAILVTAAFFILIGLFAVIYAQLASTERLLSDKAALNFEADLIASRVNTLYYTGQGGQYILERKTNSKISYSDDHLEFTLGNIMIKKQVRPNVEVEDFGTHIKIVHEAGKVRLTSP